jgi:hypothetical protein
MIFDRALPTPDRHCSGMPKYSPNHPATRHRIVAAQTAESVDARRPGPRRRKVLIFRQLPCGVLPSVELGEPTAAVHRLEGVREMRTYP